MANFLPLVRSFKPLLLESNADKKAALLHELQRALTTEIHNSNQYPNGSTKFYIHVGSKKLKFFPGSTSDRHRFECLIQLFNLLYSQHHSVRKARGNASLQESMYNRFVARINTLVKKINSQSFSYGDKGFTSLSLDLIEPIQLPKLTFTHRNDSLANNVALFFARRPSKGSNVDINNDCRIKIAQAAEADKINPDGVIATSMLKVG